MTYFPLHDESSNFYADAEDMNDCTVAKLDGSEGDWMMYEPVSYTHLRKVLWHTSSA